MLRSFSSFIRLFRALYICHFFNHPRCSSLFPLPSSLFTGVTPSAPKRPLHIRSNAVPPFSHLVDQPHYPSWPYYTPLNAPFVVIVHESPNINHSSITLRPKCSDEITPRQIATTHIRCVPPMFRCISRLHHKSKICLGEFGMMLLVRIVKVSELRDAGRVVPRDMR